jgi:CRISPR/Cas system endoribonuclease Cas6 (RAMP superfamily)
LELDYQQLVGEARQVRVVEKDLRGVTWQRYSVRQQRRIPWEGFVGRVKYEGEVAPFLPYLLLGEIVGVGKNCTFGLGRYRLFHENSNVSEKQP